MKNKYIQPICDCGSILKLHESHGIEYFYKMSNQGKKNQNNKSYSLCYTRYEKESY